MGPAEGLNILWITTRSNAQLPMSWRNTMAVQLLREKNKLVKASAEN
jgi:hypothetical protein